MMKLYIVTIRGYKYYFKGELSPNDCATIETICNNYSLPNTAMAIDDKFKELLSMIATKIDVPIAQIEPEYIFRIK